MRNRFDNLDLKRYASNNKNKSKRANMVGQGIKELISKELIKIFPGVTMTNVDISPDLMNAKLFFVTSCDNTREQTLKMLKAEVYKQRLLIGQKMRLRKVLNLEWCLDKSFYHADNIREILNDVDK